VLDDVDNVEMIGLLIGAEVVDVFIISTKLLEALIVIFDLLLLILVDDELLVKSFDLLEVLLQNKMLLVIDSKVAVGRGSNHYAVIYLDIYVMFYLS
jgi:hypothetical protein